MGHVRLDRVTPFVMPMTSWSHSSHRTHPASSHSLVADGSAMTGVIWKRTSTVTVYGHSLAKGCAGQFRTIASTGVHTTTHNEPSSRSTLTRYHGLCLERHQRGLHTRQLAVTWRCECTVLAYPSRCMTGPRRLGQVAVRQLRRAYYIYLPPIYDWTRSRISTARRAARYQALHSKF